MSNSTSGGNSVFDSSFDYRSLLPTAIRGTSEEPEPEDEGLCGLSILPDLSWRERLIGCCTCVVVGYLLSFGSFWRLADLVRGNPAPFVLTATVGNIIALAGSCFLSGPKTQVRRMWHESRRIATAMYLGSLFLTLFVAFVDVPGPRKLYLVILVLVQYVAVAWYCLSYVPFARDAIKGYIQRQWSGDY